MQKGVHSSVGSSISMESLQSLPGIRGEPLSPATTQLMVFLQMELKAGKGASERPGPDWKAALQREREEQQHLLAESYSAVMELTRQLQMSERHWSQEKLQLVERLQGEKQQVEQQVKELQNRLSQVRWDPGAQAAEALRERRESRAIDFASIFQAPLCSLRSYVCQPRMPASHASLTQAHCVLHILQLNSCNKNIFFPTTSHWPGVKS